MSSATRPVLPFVAALAGVACLSLMDALMKSASLAIGVYTASLLRSALAAALIAPVWLATGPRRPPRPVMRLHAERGVLSAGMALGFFYALTKLPIAEAIALSFCAPILALYFAHLLLKEAITRGAIWASLLGLAGTLVILSGRMGAAGFTTDTALGLATLAFSAVLYAYSFVVIRRQSQLAGPVEIATFHSAIAALVQALALPFLFVMPDADAFGITAAAAVLTVLAAVAIAWAYARAEAQALVPIEYSGFLWAILFGWLFFREAVTLPTVLGAALIVTGCWIAAPRGRKRPLPEPTLPEPPLR